jgi:hypothetical protein
MSGTGRELWKWRGGGNRGKPRAGFPRFPPPLGNLANSARDSHIPTAPTTMYMVQETKPRRRTTGRRGGWDAPSRLGEQKEIRGLSR